MKNKLNTANRWMTNSSAYMLVLLFLMTAFTAKAGEENKELVLDGTDIINVTSYVAEDLFPDTNFDPNWMNNEEIRYQEVQNYVLLRINPNVSVAANYTAKLVVDIIYQDEDNNAFEQKDVILKVEHNNDAGVVHNDRDAYLFTGGHAVEVKIKSLTFGNGASPDYSNLELVNHITINRLYDFSVADVPGLTVKTQLTANKEIDVEWTAVEGAEEYQLEWLHINDYEMTSTECDNLTFNFRNNSTRITTTQLNYKISLVFEQGYVLFRVRALTLDETDFDLRIPGTWSSLDAGQDPCDFGSKFDIQTFSIHEQDEFNWQYSASYAEEGKKKEVVTYFDGSLRSHQVVTRINTDQQTIVGETFYDHQGRAAVQALPAPVHDLQGEKIGVLGFYEKFNKDENSQPNEGYNRNHFDVSIGSCDLTANPMSTVSGASRYYSPDNPDQAEHQAYVPDALLYPFTHVEYEPDNTGRIRRQSGVGRAHQLGRGHDTKYYYGKPSQEELNRLFGSEAGWNEHYKKNMVIDPNGQVSVSYMDQQGRTIATALAGEKPDNLDALPSNGGNANSMTINILDNQPIQPGAEPVISTYHHLVTTEGTHTFSYTLQEPELTNNGDISASFCLNCVYDIKIDVIGECGSSFASVTEEGITMDNLPYTEDFPPSGVILPVGKYVITRTIQLNQEALQDNTEACIAGGGFLTWQEFYDANPPDLTQCEQPTCKSICEDLPTQAQVRECMLDCEFGDPCERKEQILYGDFVPTDAANSGFDLTDDMGDVTETIPVATGQYALYISINADGSVNTSDDHSILNPDTELQIIINGQTQSAYYQEIPEDAYIYTYVEIEEDGTETLITESIIAYNSAGEPVSPDELTPEEFINAYEPHWSQVFVSCHPEFCQLELCGDNKESQRYDFLMMTTDSYTEAYELGLLNPLTMSGNGVPTFDPPSPDSPYDADPFFENGGEGFNWRGNMIQFLQGYPGASIGNSPASVWTLAAAVIVQAETDNDPNNDNFQYIADADACVRDRIWQIFRAMYLGEKMRIYEEYVDNDDNCSPPEGKVSHFPEFEEVMEDFMGQIDDATGSGAADGGAAELDGEAQAAIALQCAERAEALADTWMQKLEGCADAPNWDDDVESAVRQELINVMVATCDAAQPFGASDGATGTTYASFDAVLTGILTPANITLTCNADLITFPNSNGHDYASYAPFKPLDECACDAILESEVLFITEENNGTLPTGANTAEEFFEYTYEIEVDGYDAKVCACNKAAGGAWVSGYDWQNADLSILENSGEYIYADIACQNCGDCTKIRGSFNSYRDGWLNGASESTLSGEELSNLYSMTTNYLNNLYDLDLTYAEYAEFVEDCNTIGPGNPICEELTQQGTAFVATLDRLTAVTHTLINVNCLCVEPLLTPYAPELAEVLNPDFNTDEYCHDIYTPYLPTMTTTYMHIDVESTTGQECDWTIEFVNPGIGYELANINSTLLNVRPDDNDPTNTQVFLADVMVQVDGVSQEATIRVTTDCYEIWECIDDIQDMQLCNHVFVLDDENDCEQDLIDTASDLATNLYNEYIEEITEDIEDNYIEQCTPSESEETFDMTYPDNEYHYTLYYYNQAGNLTRTVPPEGVELLSSDLWESVDTYREYGFKRIPIHRMSTRYKYNSLNQLTHQTMPDHDNAFDGDGSGQLNWSTRFFYDQLGRIVASQNSKQKAYDPDRYSYTVYDDLGRITEAGELISDDEPTTGTFETDNYPNNWSTNRVQVVRTHYDRPFYGNNSPIANEFGNAGQENLRNRVSSIIYSEELASNGDGYQSASHFSYDIHGNVKTLVQENTELAHLGQQFKTMTYEYDLISGNVHQVNYQEDRPDRFFHRYEYDGDNRITKVMTSPDGVIWDEDARYQYYQHGPLARTEIGDLRVQGCDFAYTIQGWIKGVNSNTLDPTRDIGKDGHLVNNNPNADVAPDAYGYGLQYFNDVDHRDYQAIGGTTDGTSDFMAEIRGTVLDAASGDLFNGNISKMVTAISPVNGNDPIPVQGNAYKYDQLNRILSSNSYQGSNVVSTNSFDGANNINGNYQTQYTYDANGNILSLFRNGYKDGQEQAMDNLVYHYETDVIGRLTRNRLLHVNDDESLTDNYDEDVDDQGDIANGNNYQYDAIGNLIGDNAEDINQIVWRVDGKVERVIRNAGSGITAPDLLFKYDPSGNRITKTVFHKDNQGFLNGEVTYTHYVRDASGNTMAVYKRQQQVTNNNQIEDQISLSEQHLYGSSRLGLRSLDNTLNSSTFENLGLILGEYQLGDKTAGGLIRFNLNSTNRPLGAKNYELSNHLGNVLATVSDRKLWNDGGTARLADVKSTSDYYPFGMAMADRTVSSEDYRYGFNGKEKDDETDGVGNSYDFGARNYDPRLGRFRSIDMYAMVMPSHSPYSYALNNPLYFVDEDGMYPKLSEVLADVGLELPPLAAGILDGVIDSSPLGTLGFAYDVATDPEFRQDVVDALTAIATDPVGTLGGVLSDKKESLERLVAGNATDEDKYSIGEMIGGMIAGGGAVVIFKKIIKQRKVRNNRQRIDCSCFTGKTLVHTSNGPREIKDIRVGDGVVTYDDSTKIAELRYVTDVIEREWNEIYRIYVGNEVIETINEHPFYINGEWEKAMNINVGDSLELTTGIKRVITKIDIVYGDYTVYDIQVNNQDTYYVTHTGVLVQDGSSYKIGVGGLKSIGLRDKFKGAELPLGYKQLHKDVSIANNKITFTGMMPDTDYSFVITNDGFIRIGDNATGMHYILADGAEFVKAAGKISFDKNGNVKSINSNSNYYSVGNDKNHIAEFMKTFWNEGIINGEVMQSIDKSVDFDD